MDLSARINQKSTPVTAPWERNLTHQLENYNQNSDIHPSIITEAHLKKIKEHHSHKKQIIFLSILTPLITFFATLYAASYNNWPSPFPWHPVLISATDQFITKYTPTSIPTKGSIILRAALAAYTKVPSIKHHLVIKNSSPQQSLTINAVANIDQNPYRLNINSAFNSQPNTPIFLLSEFYQDAQSYTYIKNQQLLPTDTINLIDLNNKWVAIRAPAPYVDLDSRSSQSLTSIRNVKMQKYQHYLLETFYENSLSLTNTGYEETHHALIITLSSQQLQELVTKLLEIYDDTVNTPDLHVAAKRIKDQISQTWPSELTVNLLINRDTLLIEYLYLSTQLAYPTGQIHDLSITDKIVPFSASTPLTSVDPDLNLDELDLNLTISDQLLRDIIFVLAS